MSIEAGQVIDGKYRVVKLLGQGGMGAVYLAEHLVIGRRVAVKVLLGSVAGNQTAVARFEREAQAAGRIGNDHILEIFDFGSLPDGARFMVCEYLDGETLASRLEAAGRLSPVALVPLARQLLSGLGAAHRAGVVHRDLKPENVFILKQKAGWADFVKIIDFGISKFQPLSSGENMQMTATGIVVGTPCYLSPEQARGSTEADARSDLYAVGVILYECVTGALPFNATNVNDLLFKIVLESPRPLREAAPDLDPAFAEIVSMAMARDPEKRFQSAEAFTAALDRWASGHGIPMGGPTAAARARHPSGNLETATSADFRLPSGPARSLAPTPGTWADSNVSVAAFQPKRSKLPLALVGALSGVLLVGGVTFAMLRGGKSESDAATTHSAVASTPSVAPPAVPRETTIPEGVPEPASAPSPVLVEPVRPTPRSPDSSSVRPSSPAVAVAKKIDKRLPPAAPSAVQAKPPHIPAAPVADAPSTLKKDYDYGY